MMHGAQKSDSPIVPMKPANKAGRPAAEPVEGSGGIERNAELQSTVRTQSREAVSQAQARIREAVSNAFASNTRDRSRMREFCTSGTVRGARGNPRPYRDTISIMR
jgi:hypothetical protein